MTKEAVKQHWDEEPCGTRGVSFPVGSLAYFEEIAERRDKLVPILMKYAQFDKWQGKKVLEVGCGVGSDLIKFAKDRAYVTGIDLSSKSVFLAKERLHLYRYEGVVLEADAEEIPFEGNTFDFVYSCGVIHHTPNTQQAINEIYRVVKPGGEICIMLYHKPSLVALQMYLLFGLLALKPFRSVEDILANHHESLGTKAYTVTEVKRMFTMFKELEVESRVTSYDLRYKRDGYLPSWVGNLVPNCFGWFIFVRGKK